MTAILVLAPHGGEGARAADADNSPAGADTASFSLADYRGKVVYLDFWASWCAPCKHSFPWMESMQKRFASRGFQVVAIDLDRDAKAAAAFLAKNNPSFTVLHDPEGKMARAYEIEAMPTSFVYDRLGKQRMVHQGFRESDTEDLETQIAALLAESDRDSLRR